MLKKIASFRKQKENRELIVHSLIAIFVRGGGAAISFVMTVVVARYLGAHEAGFFFLAITAVTLLGTVGRMGADNLVLRFVSIHNETQEWGKMRAIVAFTMRNVFLITTLLAIVICILSAPIAHYVFQKDELQFPLFIVALSIPFFAAYNVYAMALQATRKVLLSITVMKIISPIVVIALILLLMPRSSENVAIFYTVSCVITAAIGYAFWNRNVPGRKDTYDYKLLLQSSYPLWIVAIMQQIVIWGGQFIAGIFNNSVELAQLAAARNTALLITFILTAVNNVSAPRFASLYKQGKMQQLSSYARNTTRLMTLIATPIVLIIWIFPYQIMSLFGKDFHEGAWLLRILALGQFVSVISGSVQYLLMMSGHGNDLKKVTIFSGILALVLAFTLNPILGAVGSAIASAIALASTNLLAVRLVKKHLGFATLKIW